MQVNDRTIADCRKQQPEAQKAVYTAFAPMVLAVCRRYIHDRESAEDVMQETFVTVFTKIEQYKGSGAFEGWVRKIAVNLSLMYLRKHKYMNELDEQTTDYIDESVDDIILSAERALIERADFSSDDIIGFVAELPAGYRAVFNLFVVEDMKHKEISKLLNISEGTSKSQFLRARTKFQTILLRKAKEKLGIHEQI